MKKLIYVLVILFSTQIIFAQSNMGTIKGVVLEKANGEPIPFANVELLQGKKRIMVTTSDFDGVFTLKLIPSDCYQVKVTSTWFVSDNLIAVDILPNNTIELKATIEQVGEVGTVYYEVNPAGGLEIVKDNGEMQRLPSICSIDIVKSAGDGVVVEQSNEDNVRFCGNKSSVTFIDGNKMIGTISLPKSCYDSYLVIPVRGVSASYANAEQQGFYQERWAKYGF